MIVVFLKTPQLFLVVDVFLPVFLRGVGAGKPYHQGLLIEGLLPGLAGGDAVAVVVALEVVDVFQQQGAAENIIEGNGVVGIAVEQFHHYHMKVVVQADGIGVVHELFLFYEVAPCLGVVCLDETRPFTVYPGLLQDVEVFVKYLRKNANISNHFDMLADLYEWNHKFMNSFYFKRERGSIIHAYLEKLRGGRIFVNADNLTLCSNPYALLLYSVGEDWRKDDTIQYEDGCIQCYTKRFEDGEYLAAFRSPHNSPNNIIYLHNIYSDKMERYFNFSKNIMAVNNIKTDIQSRANGCDFDFSINIGIDGSVIQ